MLLRVRKVLNEVTHFPLQRRPLELFGLPALVLSRRSGNAFIESNRAAAEPSRRANDLYELHWRLARSRSCGSSGCGGHC